VEWSFPAADRNGTDTQTYAHKTKLTLDKVTLDKKSPTSDLT